MSTTSVAASTSWPNLYEFLLEAELAHYYNALKNDLKIASISQLKYVEEDDLAQMGMSKPEQRRLRKFFNKYYPQNYIMKIKKMILPKHKEDPDRTSILLLDSSLDRNSVRVPSKHIISADTIVINKELGVGEFGVVQQGVWTNEDGERIQVAIKCLSKERMQNNYMEFLKEAAIMHTIDHEHIVRLYGVVLDTAALMLVTELAPLRSLLECLKEPALRLSFPVILLCDFALQICEGMNYLESKRLIHRDLAARNILVFAKNNVKISDFGLSRALGVGKDYYQTNFNVNLKLPIAWCAPECINYLRFTSASDVWAYGVTLWEMFSYGFQPWPALTGQQILEAIDEPNFQRLEQPECCPKEYYTLMLKCWQHDPNKRPKFAEILNSLPDCKAEQVQAVKDCLEATGSPKTKKEMLQYKIGDVITVLDKRPVTDSTQMWKGVLSTGKTGLFNPANTVAYLGQNLPTIRPNFVKTDGKSGVYASRRRLRTDMISGPQGDCKHTGHVGLDGAFFGDISFLGDKYNQLPKQVVTPYKPDEDRERSSLTRASSDLSDKAPLLSKSHSLIDGKSIPISDNWSEDGKESKASAIQKSKINGTTKGQKTPHEYHEISDDELGDFDDFNSTESPQFESLDFGPSLMDEFLKALNTGSSTRSSDFDLDEQQSNESNNVRNEIKEITSKAMGAKEGYNTGSRKKQPMVKPISAHDQQKIESAIAMAKELACKSMLELDSKSGDSDNVPDSPKTPSSPGKHRKFSFKFKSSPKAERRNFSEEAEAIPDIQDTLSEEAKEAYNSLVEKGQTSVVPPESHQFPLPTRSSLRSIQPVTEISEANNSEMESVESNPLRMLRSGVPVRPKVRGNKHGIPASGRASTPHTAAVARLAANASFSFNNTTTPHSSNTLPAGGRAGLGAPPPPPPPVAAKPSQLATRELDLQSHPENSHQEIVRSDSNNPLPLPPRDRTKPALPVLKTHTRKHPLLTPLGMDSVAFASKLSLGKQISEPIISTNQQSDEHAEHTYSNVFVKRTVAEASNISAPVFPKRDRTLSEASNISAPIAVPESSSPESPSNENSPSSSLASPALTVEGKISALKKISDLDDSFETRIQAQIDCLDEINEEAALKKSDHVSCEDLLEFALDKPNANRTRGRAHGAYSDEVRIMQKVLAKEQVTEEACLIALNETDWDVHKAIKYQRLICLLRTHLVPPLDNCLETLIRCNWDAQQAANFLLATNNTPRETNTEV